MLWCKRTRPSYSCYSQKKKHCWYFSLRGATPTSSQVTFQLLGQRMQTLPSPRAASRVGPRLPLPFLPAVALGLGHQSQPQGYVISVHHSQQHQSSTQTHTHTQPAWLIISVAGKFWQTRSGKVKSEKSLSEILLSRHSGIGPLPFHVLLLKPRS